MATTYTNPTFTDSPVYSRAIGVHSLVVKWTFAAAIVQDDVVKMLRLPKGAVLVPDGWFIENSADFDTSTNLTVSARVTDGSTTKTVFSALTIGQSAAAVAYPATTVVGVWGFKTTNDDFRIELTFPAGPSTATSGTWTLGVSYSMDSTLSN